MKSIVKITARYIHNRQDTETLLKLTCEIDQEERIFPTPCSGFLHEDGECYGFQLDQDGQIDWGHADDGTESELCTRYKRAEVGEYLSGWDRYGPGAAEESVYRIESVMSLPQED